MPNDNTTYNTISGKYFKARLGNTIVYGMTRGEIDDGGDELDATDAESGGFGEVDIGVYQASITLSGTCKVGNGIGPFPKLRRGTFLTNLKVYARGTQGSYWNVGNALVLRCRQSGETRGRVEFSADCKTNGSYEYTNVDD